MTDAYAGWRVFTADTARPEQWVYMNPLFRNHYIRCRPDSGYWVEPEQVLADGRIESLADIGPFLEFEAAVACVTLMEGIHNGA